jgi:hypothetical protein
MALPPPRRNVRLWFVVAISLSAIASGSGVYAYEQYANHLTVSGLDWEVFVNNRSDGYLYDGSAAGCSGGCPTNAPVGSLWSVEFSVTLGRNATVANVVIPSPFALVGITPGLPFVQGAGTTTVTFHLAVQLPSAPGTYSLLGTVSID